jgi:hypothetical protein
MVLLSQLALVLTSAVRFVESARRLYRYSGETILPENVLNGEADPDALAGHALASRALCKSVLGKSANREVAEERASAEKVLRILRLADCRFLYLWEGCYEDVESARRAGTLSCLLSVTMVAFAAFPTFRRYVFNRGAYPLLAVEHLLVLLAIGWSCCSALYFASSFFERKLADRKICWNYFCSRLKNELPVE